MRKIKHSNYIENKNTKKNKEICRLRFNGKRNKRKKDISKNNNKVKVKHYSSVTINDVHKKLNDISHKPDVVILHLRTNDAPNKTSNAIVDNIPSPKHAIEKALPYCKVILSKIRQWQGKLNYQTLQRSS